MSCVVAPPSSTDEPRSPSRSVISIKMNTESTRTDFDPYHKWLGIPSDEQPPTHYRLLGLQAFESDPEVILAAVMRQSAHLKTYQLGQHSALTQKLLNEVSTAKVCLLDPQRKAAYDAHLLAADCAPAVSQSSRVPMARALPSELEPGPLSVSPIPAGEAETNAGLADLLNEIEKATHPSPREMGQGESVPRPRHAAQASYAPRPRTVEPSRLRALVARAWRAIPPRFRGRDILAAGGAAALLVLFLLVMTRTWNGTLVVQVSDPTATIEVLDDLNRVRINREAGGESVELSVMPGRGKVRVQYGAEFVTRGFTLASGAREVIRARLGITLRAISPQSVEAGEPLTLTVVPENADAWKGKVHYSLAAQDLPGASLDPQTGRFAWTPAKDQSPGKRDVTVLVVGPHSEEAQTTFAVTVTAAPPPLSLRLLPVGAKTVAAGKPLQLTVTPENPDAWQGELHYSIARPAPLGARVDSDSGEFSWTPADGTVGEFNIMVSAQARNGQTARTSFVVTVFTTSLPKSPQEKPKPDVSSGNKPPPQPPSASGASKPQPPPKLLSGIWQTSAGARFRIADGGQSLAIELIGNGGNVRAVSGELSRRKGEPDSKYFGTLEVTFSRDGKRRTIRSTAILNDENQLRFTYLDWPVWHPQTGKIMGHEPTMEDWTRSAARPAR